MSNHGFQPPKPSLPAHSPRPKNLTPIRIAGIYLVLGFLWIFYSDRFLSFVLHYNSSDSVTYLQTIKGWLYVVITAGMLYWLVGRETSISQRVTIELQQMLLDRQRTEETLRQQLNLLSLAQQAAQLGVYEWDLVTNQAYWTAEMEQLMGLKLEARHNNLDIWFAQLHPDDRVCTERRFQEWLRSDQDSAQAEYRLYRNGEERWIEARGYIVRDALGKPLRMIGTNLDITERKRTEAALRASEEQLRLTLEFAQIGSWDWNVLTNQITWNKNHFLLLGLDPETVPASYKNWCDRVHPDDLPRLEAAIHSSLQTRTPYEEEYKIIYPDGSLHWVIGKGRAIYEDDIPIRMIGVLLDSTHRKQTEELLRLREQQFRQAVMNAPYPMILHADDGEVIQINQVWTELTGYEASDIPTVADWVEKAYGQRQEVIRAAIDRLYDLNHRVYEGEFTPRTKDGKERIWDFSSAPIGVLPDERRLVLSMAVDITDRKHLEQALQQELIERQQAEEHLLRALAEKEVLLKEIHHRVKNNLQIVSGLLQLQAQGVDDPKIISALRESQNRIESMSLIHKKLYTSTDLGQLDVADYIQSLSVSLLTTYQISPGAVALNVEVEPVSLSLDQAIPCGLIVNELVSNALKYAFPNNRPGEIIVKLCQIGHQVELKIQDNGIGLPDTLDWQNTQSLGLSLVYALATDQLEGNLVLDHSVGTTVTIKFPQIIPNR